MKMVARIQLTVDVPFDSDVPELELVQEDENLAALTAKNEKAVLAARKRAAKEAEDIAKQMKADHHAVDMMVVEVRDDA